MFHCAPRTSQISSASVQSCWIECSKCVPRESSAVHQKLEQCPYGQCGDEFALVVSDSLVVINDWHCELHSYTHRIAVYIPECVFSQRLYIFCYSGMSSFLSRAFRLCLFLARREKTDLTSKTKQTNKPKKDRKKEKESLIQTPANVLLVKMWLFTQCSSHTHTRARARTHTHTHIPRHARTYTHTHSESFDQ